jgi:hypothetical protein
VQHDDGVGVLLLERPHLLSRDHVGHLAASVRYGNEHGLVGAQDRCRLGHEVDAAKDHDVGLNVGSLPAQLQGVAREVGDGLDLVRLVVVGQDDGIALGLQFLDTGDQLISHWSSFLSRSRASLRRPVR